jgi:hypothetical protein
MNISFTRRGAGLSAVVFLVAAMPSAAQTNMTQKLDQAAIQRSWDIQAQVAKIAQDKETFVNNFIGSWEPNVDARLFGDIGIQLRPLMEASTPWRLYAASLVGDYNEMLQVLRGEIPAGKVIKTLSTPQPHAMARSALTVGTVSPLSLGSATSQLVFTPIAPCRIVDTRGSGTRTGILSAGSARTFDLTSGGFSKGQGGDTSCTGLPSFNFYAWAVNITLTGYHTTGYLQAYPYGGSVPSSSIANFATALPAIANGTTVTGCYGCSDSITILASAPTQAIIDVYGYYEVATGYSTGVVTQMVGTATTVAANTYQYVQGGSCPAGTIVIGGAQTNSGSGSTPVLTSDHDFTGTSWYEYVLNSNTTTAANVYVFATCQDVQ